HVFVFGSQLSGDLQSIDVAPRLLPLGSSCSWVCGVSGVRSLKVGSMYAHGEPSSPSFSHCALEWLQYRFWSHSKSLVQPSPSSAGVAEVASSDVPPPQDSLRLHR